MAEDPPVWTADQLALLADSRLPAASRIIGLILSLGDSAGLEFGREDVRSFLGASDPSSDDTIRRLMRSLEATGWVARTPGGRDHSDTLRILEAHECGSNASIRVGMGAALSDRVGTGAALNSFRVGTGAALSPPSTTTPVPSPSARVREGVENSVSREAEAAIDRADEMLAGCRGALRDYLRQRVEDRHQHGYVQRLVTSLQGADEWMWKDRRGQTLTDGRARVLAAAFNELSACDEVGKHFPDAPGGFGNLRSKVRYLVASQLGVERDAKSEAAREYRKTAAEEEADLQAKRERARQRRHDEAERERIQAEGADLLAEVADAKAWVAAQDQDVQAAVSAQLGAGLRRLGFAGNPDLAPAVITQTALLEAVRIAKSQLTDARKPT